MTTATDGHLEPDYLRKEIGLLGFGAPLAASLLWTRPATPDRPRHLIRIARVTGTSDGAGYRVRTGDIQLGKQPGRAEQGVAGGGSGLQVGEKITTDGASRSQEFRTVAPLRSPFVTRLLPGSDAPEARLEVLRGSKDGLMSVREAAEQLGLCTATVYRLCAEGALPHFRILNAIRISPADLGAFVEAKRVSAPPGP